MTDEQDADRPEGPEDRGLNLSGGEVEAVRARHEQELLRYPHVVGVATGVRLREARPTGVAAIVVYVDRKVDESELAPGEVLPRELDGVPVDVVETGLIRPLPA